ncbi:ankyrin repeat domain-containing protein [Kitasatospora sp. NPDC088134]|uniref:ankyrin repeat domain-containing protein n=1 Tax=Kitasatospora sp. NPDC088134 TaxID=3364071 RepID=UPI00380A6941
MTESTAQPGTESADGPAAGIDAGIDAEVLALAGRLFEAARTGDTGLLTAYVDAGTPANLTNDRGDSLLMLAAYHGHAATVTALLERGAEPDRANDRGQTPLAGAVFKGATEVVDALLAHGADPYAGMPSALDAARMFGKDDLVARLTAR